MSSRTARALKPIAFVFYKPLPFRRLVLRDLSSFVVAQLRRSDLLTLAGSASSPACSASSCPS